MNLVIHRDTLIVSRTFNAFVHGCSYSENSKHNFLDFLNYFAQYLMDTMHHIYRTYNTQFSGSKFQECISQDL